MTNIVFNVASTNVIRGIFFFVKKLCQEYLFILIQKICSIAIPIFQNMICHIHLFLLHAPEHLVVVIQFAQQKCAVFYYILKGICCFSDISREVPDPKQSSGLLLPDISNSMWDDYVI